jgi:hypothetical protein
VSISASPRPPFDPFGTHESFGGHINARLKAFSIASASATNS